MAPEAKEDRLLDGRVRLRQPARGYRAGMDAALLAAACDARPGQQVIEAGCGAGAVLCQVGVRQSGLTLFGVERDPDAAALARENLALNSPRDSARSVSRPSTGPSPTRLSSTMRRAFAPPPPSAAGPGSPTTASRPGPAFC